MKTKTEQMNIDEVNAKLAELSENLRKARFGMSSAKNVKEVGNTRREIARLMTMKTALGTK